MAPPVSAPKDDPAPDQDTSTRFSRLPPQSRIERAAQALRKRGVVVEVVPDRAAACQQVLCRLQDAKEVLEASSQTLQAIGLLEALNALGRPTRLRPKLEQLAREGRRAEKRRLGAAPDVVVGSVHAVTEAGEVIVASGTGSQLGPYAYGARKVIWVVGAQKIVRDLAEGFRRIVEYAQPREDARVRAGGGAGSAANKLLIVRGEHQPGRITVILIADVVGM